MVHVQTALNTKAFTLFEVTISLVILSIALISLIRIDDHENSLSTYYKLQEIQNQYMENKIITQTQNIEFVHDTL
jgi:prepilin-type N-terminal cleavage/methylation domain-containing protein